MYVYWTTRMVVEDECSFLISVFFSLLVVVTMNTPEYSFVMNESKKYFSPPPTREACAFLSLLLLMR